MAIAFATSSRISAGTWWLSMKLRAIALRVTVKSTCRHDWNMVDQAWLRHRRHAVGPHEQRGSAEDSQGAGGDRVEAADGDGRGTDARRPGGALAGAGEERQPVAQEVEGRDAAGLAGQPHGHGDRAADRDR